jgi:hypothetical protein
MKRVISLAAMLLMAAAITTQATADEKELVGYWRVMARGPADDDWVRAGMTRISLSDGKLTITPIEFAATARDTRVGRNPSNIRVRPDSVSYRASFGKEGTGEYELKRANSNTYQGFSTRSGRKFRIRWERIAGKKELRSEISEVITELKLEKTLSERLLAMYQGQLGEVQVRQRLEQLRRAIGLPAHNNTIDGIVGIYKTGDVAREQGRLAIVNEKLAQAEAALIKWTK